MADTGTVFHSVLVTSIAEAERAAAEAALPGAKLVSDRFSAALAEEEPGTRVLCVMVHDPVLPDALAALPHLEAVITRSDGHDHLPIDWLREHGIPAFHLAGYATQAVAELAVLHILALLRRVPEATAVTRHGSWDRGRLVGRALEDVTVGVLGTGRIGGAVVRMLPAMGAPRILGHDIAPDPALRAVAGFRYVDSLDAFLRGCDVLTVHVPLTADTNGLLDAGRLGLLPDHAVLVNTARGEVVDQAAVEAALRSDRLDGYAADVLPSEPAAPDLVRFRDRRATQLTPHLGAHTPTTIRRRYETTAAIAAAVLEGRPSDVESHRVA